MRIGASIPLLLILSFNGLDARAFEPPQNSFQAPSEVEKAEYQRLNGKWRVRSAMYQLGSDITYTFDNGSLVIASRPFPEGKDGRPVPVHEYVSRYRYRLASNRVPKQIVLTPVDRKGAKEQKRIYEFREGMLWMAPDDEGTAKGPSSLSPGKGGSGWLEGLEPIQ